MEWSRQLKALIKAAEAQGWRVERRSKRYLFFSWDGETPRSEVEEKPR